jgi:hypothetical protein
MVEYLGFAMLQIDFNWHNGDREAALFRRQHFRFET